MGEKLGGTELFWEDAVVIAIYFFFIIAVGMWSSYRSTRDSVTGYFLASRSMHWIPVGASLFASNIGSGHFIGLAGSGASSGIGIAGFELNAMFMVMMLGWFFVPVYIASGVYTMPEYLKKRYGGERIRVYLSVLALLLYIFTKISADLYAGAIFIHQSIKLDMYSSILALLVIAALFTIAGGLSAVIWTDFAQTVLMLIGALSVTAIGFIRIGGYNKLVHDFKNVEPNETFIGYNALNESCSKVPDNYMHLIRSPLDKELPFTGMILGLTANSIWYWCSDQVIVQRALSSRSLSHAKMGCILCGYLKLLPLFIIVFPGMMSRVLFPDEVACSNPVKCKEICGSELGCTNIAYPKLVLELMPEGARGLMISVMLAALMSSLTSIFNSSSTIFSIDIWRRIRKNATETELLVVGRVFVILIVGISIIWIPIVQAAQNSQLFHYINSVTSYLSPPVCAVYVFGIIFKRINEKGAFWGLIVGLAVGLTRFIWEFSYTTPSCASGLPDPRPAIIAKVHYLHFSIILFIVSGVVTVGVSLLTEPIDKIHLHRLIFWNRHSKEVRVDITKKQSFNQENNSENGIAMNKVNTYRESETKTKTNDIQIKSVEVFCIEKSIDNCKDADFEKGKPLWKRTIYLICGIPKTTNMENIRKPSAEEEASQAAEAIHEKPVHERLCNANAILLLVISCFIWGYFA